LAGDEEAAQAERARTDPGAPPKDFVVDFVVGVLCMHTPEHVAGPFVRSPDLECAERLERAWIHPET
jgi:hypothetical protein